MPKPENVTIAADADNRLCYYKISWKADYPHYYSVIATNVHSNPRSIYQKSVGYCYIRMESYEQIIVITTKSSDLNEYADSEPVIITAPAVDLEKYYLKSSYTIDLTSGSCKIDDNVFDTFFYFAGTYKLSYIVDSENVVKIDLDKNGSYDIILSYRDDPVFKNAQISVLPSNSISDQITFVMTDEDKKRLVHRYFPANSFLYEKLTFVFSKTSSQDKSEQKDVPTVNGQPVDTANILKTVMIDDITYIIDVNDNATAIKIASKKKASLDTITVDGKTYPVVAIADNACKNNKKIKTVTIGSNVSSIGKKAFFKCKKLKKVTIKANKNLKIGKSAFKKINKGATIKIKGVKGNAKKKLIKAINK